MSIPATEVEARWNAAAEPFTAVVREVRDWDAATPCSDWTAREVAPSHNRRTKVLFFFKGANQ